MQAQRRLIVVGVVVVLQLWWAGKQLEMRVDAAGINGCGEACERNEDCRGSLFCAEEGVCAVDSQLGTSDCDGALGSITPHDKQKKEIDSSPSCKPTSFLKGKTHSCKGDYNAECCHAGERYPQYKCSPKVSARTSANLTVNDFSEGGDGGGPAECDGKFHKATEKVVALSTGWYNKGKRCNKKIRIFLDSVSVEATVKDECDSFNGCDKEHDYQVPCDFDIVDASNAVWEALGISKDDPRYGFTQVQWADA